MEGRHCPNRLGNSDSVPYKTRTGQRSRGTAAVPLGISRLWGYSQHPPETELLLRAKRYFLPKPGRQCEHIDGIKPVGGLPATPPAKDSEHLRQDWVCVRGWRGGTAAMWNAWFQGGGSALNFLGSAAFLAGNSASLGSRQAWLSAEGPLWTGRRQRLCQVHRGLARPYLSKEFSEKEGERLSPSGLCALRTVL